MHYGVTCRLPPTFCPMNAPFVFRRVPLSKFTAPVKIFRATSFQLPRPSPHAPWSCPLTFLKSPLGKICLSNGVKILKQLCKSPILVAPFFSPINLEHFRSSITHIVNQITSLGSCAGETVTLGGTRRDGENTTLASFHRQGDVSGQVGSFQGSPHFFQRERVIFLETEDAVRSGWLWGIRGEARRSRGGGSSGFTSTILHWAC